MTVLVWVVSACAFGTLVSAQKPEVKLIVQTGHAGYVTFLKIGPNGKLVASGDQYSLILWDAATGRQIRTLKEADPETGLGIDYRSISFDRDWHFLIDGAAIIEVSTGRRVKTFDTPFKDLGSSVLSANGKTFAATDRSGTYAGIWSTATGKRLHLFRGESLTFSQTGSLIASTGPFKTVSSVRPTSQPESLAKANSSIHIFSIAAGKEIAKMPNGPNEPISMTFTADETKIVAVTAAGLKVWDIARRKTVQNLKGDFSTLHIDTAAHSYDSPVRIYFSQAGTSMVAANEDEIKFWDIRSAKITRVPVEDIELRNVGLTGSAFSPDGETFVDFRPVYQSVVAEFWDVKTGRLSRSIENKGYRNVAKVPAVFTPDGGRVAIGRANEVDLWDISTAAAQKQSVFRPIVHSIANVSLGIDGKTLAVSSDDELVDTSGVAGVDITAAINDERSDFFDDAVLFWRLDGSADPVRFEGALLYSNPFEWNPPEEGIFYHSDFLIGCVKANDQVVCQIRETATGNIKKTLVDYNSFFGGTGDSLVAHQASLSALSADLNRIALSSRVDELEFWDITDPSGFVKGPPVQTGNITSWQLTPKKPLWKITVDGAINSIVFGPDEKTIQLTFFNNARKIFRVTVDAANGSILEQIEMPYSNDIRSAGLSIEPVNNGSSVSLVNSTTEKQIAELYWLNRDDWAVVTPDGRFDTNLDLDGIEGLHWVISDDPFSPKSLEVFLRQYYEPGLLQRILRCTSETRENPTETCDMEFKPLPSIDEINRVQPRVVFTSGERSGKRSGLGG
jgi:WD40 repeat protein